MVPDFLCGSMVTSVLGYAALWWYVLARPSGGAGLAGVASVATGVALVLLNCVMVLGVRAGASIRIRSANGPVTVRPRRLMVYLGLVAVPAGMGFVWLVASVFPPVLILGRICDLFLAPAPVALITWLLARPSART